MERRWKECLGQLCKLDPVSDAASIARYQGQIQVIAWVMDDNFAKEMEQEYAIEMEKIE